ncbi:hypothetical protein [Streptomyces sp. Agncl-13]|uniref:hypothetical protein n=1 Tax=Streptomyces sp. Agncl-13 TaxID=3400628 RepID=UPI003A86BD5E
MFESDRSGPVNPTASEATRFLCQALYARPDRVGDAKARWRAARGKAGKPDKPRRSTRRRIYLEGSDKCPPLGEPMAQWAVDHVLRGPTLPVPSHGFDLVPVLTHSLRVRRRRWLRRGFVFLGLAWAAYLAPLAAGVWGVAMAAALLVTQHAARTAERRGLPRPTRSPRLAYGLLAAPLVLTVLPLQAAGLGSGRLRVMLLLLPLAALVTVTFVCAMDRLAARAALTELRHDTVTAYRLRWIAPRTAARLKDIGAYQTRRELPYDTEEHFVGAGRDAWFPARINIPLQPKDPDERLNEFGEEELLQRVGAALNELGRNARDITDRLPGFSEMRVVGLPAHLWLQRSKTAEVDFPVLRGRGRRSPSSLPNRGYLRAQCVSWSGQLVVSVFVHAALEARELRLTVRPHVMTPLFNELRLAGNPAARHGLRLLGWVTAQGFLDTVLGTTALWRVAGRLDERAEERAEEMDPVSLRDRFSVEEATDMHQSDDAGRHVVLIQTCVFRTVETYLEDMGIDTAAYRQQVASVVSNVQIYGDNSAPIQSFAGFDTRHVNQTVKDSNGKGGT